MKILFLLFLARTLPRILSDEDNNNYIYHYIPLDYLHSCEQTCELLHYTCSMKMDSGMNCQKSAMLYCQTYLNYDTDGELSLHEEGCLVDCDKLLYIENGPRDCELGAHAQKERFYRPVAHTAIPICKCYTEESQSGFITQRLKIGLLLLIISVGGYLLLEIYTRTTKGRSYISLLLTDEDENTPMISNRDVELSNGKESQGDEEEQQQQQASIEGNEEDNKQSVKSIPPPTSIQANEMKVQSHMNQLLSSRQDLDSSFVQSDPHPSDNFPSYRSSNTSSATSRYGLSHRPPAETSRITPPPVMNQNPIRLQHISGGSLSPTSSSTTTATNTNTTNATNTRDRFQFGTSSATSRYGGSSRSS